MVPSSPQRLQCQPIGESGWVQTTMIRPGQRRLAGRRRHGRALSQAVWASPAVAAATMLVRCSAEPACWARGVGGQVEEVVQIGDQHVLAL